MQEDLARQSFALSDEGHRHSASSGGRGAVLHHKERQARIEEDQRLVRDQCSVIASSLLLLQAVHVGCCSERP